ncbi:TIGR04282 family arsenosugar biosynthesis glycosyltransferase [Aequorivita echinoideorum]|uniref:TIGR04282 family arsenosugar biosynthesis glycosyltransferase n=1 Tax=Aequorivita echinoideorum TaxID=1549647 RepID=A0ABS5S392_9FLAO|nr:TIGR04282 family arsenosugar biosynthesis glycosyltransferase [Aequorivita echinoideorum]MBT0607443.1 TIGR04282 family arsenosugar biosynthesis glycosyltransferase [Aequorivita echinoideorum]
MAVLSKNDVDGNNEMAFDFHFPSSKKAIIVFTRNPELGKVKTRLAKSIGDESALKVYQFLLQHTVKITENLNADKYVFYSEKIRKDDIWNPEIFRKKIQKGEDLGERMENAFTEIFSMGYEKVLIVGSDIYELQQKDIEKAFEALEENKYVIGPAEDGGYYLFGMTQLNPKVFKNKNWGTNTVLRDTLNDIEKEKYIELAQMSDVDYYEDIKNIDVFQQFLPPYLDKNFL